MLTDIAKAELSRLAFWMAVATLFGWLLGWPVTAAFVAIITYALLQLWHANRLLLWLRTEGEGERPEAFGIWGALFDYLGRWQQRNRGERERLEATIDYLRESFMSLPFGAVMLDANSNIEWSNAAARHLLGLRYPEDRGQPLLNLVRDPLFVDYYEKRNYEHPLEFHSPLNRKVHLQAHITHFGYGSRLLFVSDITQIRRLERMRQDFVANVSHELRTPLTVINGYLETFADSLEGTNPRWQRAVRQMLQQSRRMQSLVNDLILLSRLETLPQGGGQERVQLRSMLEVIREEALASVTTSRVITLQCDDTLSLVGNREELRSAFSNVIFNAAKYTEENGHIDIRWHADEQGAYLEVEDDGIGIDEVEIPRLTERFYRVDTSRSIETGGTGLGLAIVKHVLLRHQAELVVKSTPGRGSCFVCSFPLLRTVRHVPLENKDLLEDKHLLENKAPGGD